MKAHKNAVVIANIWQKDGLLPAVNDILAAHKNAVVIANIQQNFSIFSGVNACRSTDNIQHRNNPGWGVEPYTPSEFPASRLRNARYARSLAACFES